MRSWKISTIPITAVLIAIPLFLSGCPKRTDLPAGAATQPSTGQMAEQPSGAASSPTTSPVAPPSSSYSSSLRTQEETVSPPAAIPPEAPAKGAPLAGPTGMAGKEASPLKDIFFDFDKSNIRDDAKPNLADDAQWLKTNTAAQITIEGHCDERGTAEYNLGLGERRAKATLDYLVAAGIDPKRIKIISYGKERPFVLGHDESAWKWNRRAHFVLREK